MAPLLLMHVNVPLLAPVYRASAEIARFAKRLGGPMGRALKMPEFDDDGLLAYPARWSERLAQAIAREDGLGELTDDHWAVIRHMRMEFELFGSLLAIRRLSVEDMDEKERVHALFRSYLEAWRVSGLPNPGDPAKNYLARA